MDERLFYSMVLLVSMMLLCTLIPPNLKQKVEEEPDKIDLKSQLISQLLYPKIIGQLSSDDESVIPLKVNSDYIKLSTVEKVNEIQTSVKLEFSSFLNDERIYADYVTTYFIDGLGHIEIQTFEQVKIYEDLLPLVEVIHSED